MLRDARMSFIPSVTAIGGMAGVFWAVSKVSVSPVQDFDLFINFEVVLLMAAAGDQLVEVGVDAAGFFDDVVVAKRGNEAGKTSAPDQAFSPS